MSIRLGNVAVAALPLAGTAHAEPAGNATTLQYRGGECQMWVIAPGTAI